MKKLFKIILLLLVLSLMNSCSGPVTTITQEPITSALPERTITLDNDGNLDYEAMWPNKNVLVWAYSDVYEINHYIEQLKYNENDRRPYEYAINNNLLVAYNDYLVSKGSEYVIKPLNEMCIIDRILEDYQSLGDDEFAKSVFKAKNVWTYFYDLIREMKEEGKQVDIISTGTQTKYTVVNYKNGVEEKTSGVALDNPSDEAIRDGLLLDISDYILSKDDTRLYKSLPCEYWKLFSEYNGIYGLYNNGLALCQTFHLRNDIIEKYSIDVSNLNTINNIDILCDKLFTDYSDEISETDLMLIQNRITPNGYHNIIGIHINEKNQFLAYRYDNNNNPIAINRFTDADYINLNNLLAKWVDKNYFNGSEYKEVLNSFSYSVSSSPNNDKPKQFLSFISYNDLSSSWSDAGYIPVEISKYVLKDSKINLIGVASWSKNAGYAYDFLSLLYTDPVLTNLMYYGEDYTLVDNKINRQGLANRMSLVCNYLIYPNKPVSSSRQDISEIVNDLYIPPDYAFEPNLEGMEYDFLNIDKLCKEADALWSSNPADIDKRMSEIVLQLESLGYDKLIEEIDGQLKEHCKDEFIKPE